MSKPIIAILAGHYGSRTGASYGTHDEWSYARRDALMLYSELIRDDVLMPILEPLETKQGNNKLKSIREAAAWANMHNAAVVIEFHYNSADSQDRNIKGNELVVPSETAFSVVLDKALATLPNKHRRILVDPELELFENIDVPVAIIESAFVWEPEIETPEWGAMLAVAVKQALYKYFKGVQYD